MNLTGSEKEILSYLLNESEATRYDAKKNLDMPYGTAHGSFKSLEGKGMIREAREEKTEKGTAKTYFCLTPLGTLRAASERIRSLRPERVPVTVKTEGGQPLTFKLSVPELADWEDMPEAVEKQLEPDVLEKLEEYEGEKPYHEEIREVAEKHGDSLPLILGKWDFFRRQGIENVVALSIYHAPSELNWSYLAEEVKTENEDVHRVIEVNFYSEMLSRHDNLQSVTATLTRVPGLKTHGVKFEEIASTLAEDPDLAPMVKRKVEVMYEEKEKEYERIKRLRDSLEVNHPMKRAEY